MTETPKRNLIKILRFIFKRFKEKQYLIKIIKRITADRSENCNIFFKYKWIMLYTYNYCKQKLINVRNYVGY